MPSWLAIAAMSAAHAADVTGQVRERGSGIPVEATVRIGDRQVDTDERGRFVVDLPPGPHLLEVMSPEHQILRLTVDVPLKERLRLFLEPLDTSDVIIVEGHREHRAGTVVRTQQQLRETPGAFGDPVRAIETAPSVAASRFGDEGLIVRGAEPTTTAVRIDGMDVPWLYHWYFLRSVVDPSAIEGLTLRPSGLPASQGGFAQGLLTVDLKEEVSTPGFHGRASFDLLDLSVAGAAQLTPRWHLFVGGRVSWGGELGGAIGWLASGRQVYLPVRWNDAHVRLVGHLGDHQITATAFGALDSLRAFGPDGSALFADEDQDLPYDPARAIDHRFARTQLAWSTDTGRFFQRTALQFGVDVDASLFGGLVSGSGSIGLVGGPTFGSLTAWRFGARHEHRVPLGDSVTLHNGVDADLVRATDRHYGRLDDDGDPVPHEQTLGLVAPWTGLDIDTSKVRVEAGFRGTTHVRNGASAFVPEPRLGLVWRTSEALTVTADVGANSQRPPVWMSSESFGVPELSPVYAWQSSLGAIWQASPELTLTSTLYGSWFPSLLVKDVAYQALLTPDSAPRYTLDAYPVYVDVEGASAGVELGAAWRHQDRAEIGASVALGRALRFDGPSTWAAARDQPVQASLWGAWRPTPQWSFSARGQVAQGPPWNDPQTPLGEGPTVREPWLAQLDLRAARTFVGKRARWTVYADVFNATRSKIPFISAVPPGGTRPLPYIYVGIIPNLGLEVTF